jgi:hypothetical protein
MATKADKKKHADTLGKALDAFEAATPEEQQSTDKGSISDVAHQAVKDGLKLAGDDPYSVQVLRTRGFIDNNPEQWLKSARALEVELRG